MAPAEDPATGARAPDDTSGTRVDLGADASAGLEEFLTAPRLLYGDVIEIDMSRKPFFGRSTMSISAKDVERTELVDGERGLLTITLTNTSGYTTVLNALPNVRIGDGFEVYGTHKIVLRYWTRQTTDRPVHFHGVATGAPALLSEGDAPEPRRGEKVELTAEVRGTGDGYRFERWAEVKQ